MSFTFLWISGVTGIKDLRISVPAMVKSGDASILTCSYDLEGAPLYTVKWYHGDFEFYRYAPKENPKQNVFDRNGIQVDVSNRKKMFFSLR